MLFLFVFSIFTLLVQEALARRGEARAAAAARGDVLQHAVAVHVRVRVEGRQEHLAQRPTPEQVHHLDALLLVRDDRVGAEIGRVRKKRVFARLAQSFSRRLRRLRFYGSLCGGTPLRGAFVMLESRQHQPRVLPPRPPVRCRARHYALAKLAARGFAEVPPLGGFARGGVQLVVVLRRERVRQAAHVPVEIVALVFPAKLPSARLERVVVEVPRERRGRVERVGAPPVVVAAYFFAPRAFAARVRPHGFFPLELGVQRVERPARVRLFVDHAEIDPAAHDHRPAVAFEQRGGGDQNSRLARLGVLREIPPQRAFPHHPQVVVETHDVPPLGDHHDDPFVHDLFVHVRTRHGSLVQRRRVSRGKHAADADGDGGPTPGNVVVVVVVVRVFSIARVALRSV